MGGPLFLICVKISRTTLVGVALVIFAASVWLYWPSVHGGFLTHMDDDEYLRQSVRLKGLTWDALKWAFTSTQPYYHPLPRVSHVLDYQMWGTNARGHHATSVVLHALNAGLVFGFLWTLLAAVSLTTSERLMTALGVAVVFAIHPLQVESVAWISGRTQLLCVAFGIGALWAYVAGAHRGVVGGLYVAALLCKPMAVSLPFAMLAIDYFPLRRHEQLGWGRLVREKAAWIALAVAAVAATVVAESRAGGLMVTLEKITPAQRVLLAVQSLAFYPWKLVWPAGLSPYYPLRLGISLGQPLAFASALGVGVVTLLSVRHRRRTPALAASWGAYVMFVLPVSGLLQTGGQAVANRYAYMAMLPLLLLAGAATIWLWRRGATAARVALACLLVCGLGSFGLRTRSQIPVWRNDETLWRAVLAQFPNSAMANRMLAETLLLRQNRIPEAVEYGQRAVRIAPEDAVTQNNLGIALFLMGKPEAAIAHYEQALRSKPDYADAHCNLGNVLAHMGKIEEAIAHYQQALRIKPDLAEAHCNLGNVLAHMGKIEEAIAHDEQALRINPDLAEAHSNLGDALLRQGKVPEAIEHYEQALKLKPDLTAARNALARLRAGQ
jgi:Flp pilus assembly protein TadD